MIDFFLAISLLLLKRKCRKKQLPQNAADELTPEEHKLDKRSSQKHEYILEAPRALIFELPGITDPPAAS